MMVLRSLTAILLACALVVTSLSAGMARGQAAPVGLAEICQGLTTTTVQIDADGNPVRHVHLCPDGVMSLVAPVGAAGGMAAPVPVWVALPLAERRAVLAGHDVPLGVARGPPYSL